MSKKRAKLHSEYCGLGDRLKYLREHYTYITTYHEKEYEQTGITQHQFAELLNVSDDTVKNWEQEYNFPRYPELKAIANLFKCDYDYLLGSQDIPNKYAGLTDKAAKILSESFENGGCESDIISALIEDREIMQILHRLYENKYSHISGYLPTDPLNPNGSEPFFIDKNFALRSDLLELLMHLMRLFDSDDIRQLFNFPSLDRATSESASAPSQIS